MRKKKDHRYRTIKIMFASGKINCLKDIFDILPRSVVAGDLRTNNNRFHRLIQNPGQFTFDDVKQMARLIGCKYAALRDLIEREIKNPGAQSGAKILTKKRGR